MSRPPRPALVTLVVVFSELIWALNSIAGKFGLMDLGPLAMASFRLVLAGLIMAPIYFLAPRPSTIERSDIPTLVLLGFFGVAINQACFTIGLNYTTVGHSAIIISVGPVLVLALARAMHLEALTSGKVAGMALSFAGCVILATEYGIHLGSGTLRGDLITLLGTTGFAIYAVLGKKVVGKYDTVTMNAFCHLTAAILWAPVALYEGTRLDWVRVRWQSWAGLGYMSLFGSVIGYLIFYWALHHMTASRLAAFSYLIPVLATALGVLVLGEALTGRFVGGGALVMAGVYLAERGRANR